MPDKRYRVGRLGQEIQKKFLISYSKEFVILELKESQLLELM